MLSTNTEGIADTILALINALPFISRCLDMKPDNGLQGTGICHRDVEASGD
jgi:hypothetical protein